MTTIDIHGERQDALAINEVSLLRENSQVAKLRISVDGHARMDELIADGVLIATPAARPPTTSPPTDRSCRSTRRCWRSPRSHPSAPALARRFAADRVALTIEF